MLKLKSIPKLLSEEMLKLDIIDANTDEKEAPKSIAHVFNKFGNYLKMFKDHCVSLSTINNILTELLEKDKNFIAYHNK